MNWSDFELNGEQDLEIDDFTGSVFGEGGHLRVLGWHPSHKYGKTIKKYFIECSICKTDSIFRINIWARAKADLVAGKIPCRCSSSHIWTEEENIARAKAKCETLGYVFNGWDGEYSLTTDTRAVITSPFGTSSISFSKLLEGARCPFEIKNTRLNTTIEENIKQFKSSGKFPGNTTFRYLPSKDDKTINSRWEVVCGACGDITEESYSSVTNNTLSCNCFKKKEYESLNKKILEQCENLGCNFVRYLDETDTLTFDSKIIIDELRKPVRIGYFLYTLKKLPKYDYPKYGGIYKTKTDTQMSEEFKAIKGIHPDSVFRRSERLTTQGTKNYWHWTCGECGLSGESLSSHIKRRRIGCDCSPIKQKEAYINFGTSFIKFGISSNSVERVKRQNKNNIEQLIQYCVYEFPDRVKCRAAERECLTSLECGIVDKYLLPDGYTETTYLSNLYKIIEIYERNGGVKLR